MAVTEEFLRLFVETKGAEKLPALAKDLKAVTEAEYELAGAAQAAGAYELVPSALDKIAQVAPQAVVGLKKVEAATRDVEVAARRAEEAARKLTETKTKMAAAAALSQQRVTGLSYALNDFFGAGGGLGQKITSVANNLPMLLSGFGNLGLALSALVPILGLVVSNWDIFTKMLGMSGDEATTTKEKIEALKKQVEALASKPGKLSLDFTTLNDANKKMEELEKRLAAFNAGKVTAEAADLGALAMKAGKETMGSEGLKKAVFDINRTMGITSATGAQDLEKAELTERQARLQRMATEKSKFTGRFLYGESERADFGDKAKVIGRQLKALQAKIDAGDVAAAEETVGGFLGGDIGEIGAMKGRAAKVPGAFTPEFRKSLGMLPGSSEEWAMMRGGAKASAKESVDFAREAEMKKADTAAATKTAEEAEKTRKPVETFIAGQKKVVDEMTKDMAKVGERAVGVFTKQAKEGTYDEFATMKAAQLRAQGGYEDSRTGRFIPLDEAGQRAALQGLMEKKIGGEYGGASKGVAAALTREAFGEVERKSADLTAAGFGQAAANQAVMNESIQALQAQVAKLAGVGKQIGRGRDGQVSRLGVTR